MSTTLNIYDVGDYAAGTTYSLDNIVKFTDGKFYYSLVDNNAGNTPAVDSMYWGGYTYNAAGRVKPYFFWKPSYGTPIEPNIKTINTQFSDGYSQRSKRNINNTLLILSLRFNNVKLNRAAAIFHFLDKRQGVESFLFTPPPPVAKMRHYICQGWRSVDNFYDNYSIEADFIEVAI